MHNFGRCPHALKIRFAILAIVLVGTACDPPLEVVSDGRGINATNTGPAGKGCPTPTENVGGITTSQDGQVIENVVASTIVVAHNDVMVRCVIVDHPVGVNVYGLRKTSASLTGTLVQYSEFDGNGDGAQAPFVNMSNVTFYRNHVHGFKGGGQFGSNSVVAENLVSGVELLDGSHNSGMSTHGATDLLFFRNRLEGMFTSGALNIYGDFDCNINITVDGNFLNAIMVPPPDPPGAIYQMQGGGHPGKLYTACSSGIVIKNNIFGNQNAGFPQVITSLHPEAVLSNNVDVDGNPCTWTCAA